MAGTVDLAKVLSSGAGPFLRAAGLPAAYDDESWDENIRARMQVGLDLVGGDVGTPIIGFDTPAGRKGVFGPIVSPARQCRRGRDVGRDGEARDP